MCSSTLSVNCEYVEKWAHTVRPYGRVTRLPFSYFSKQSPVSGMRQVKKQKEVGVKRVETIGVYPLAPPAGEAGFSRFASENPNFWNDNENPLKRHTIDFANLPYSFEPIYQKSITRDSDAKYKTKTDAIHVCNRKTAQTGRKKEPCFRTALQKFT